MVGLFGCVYLFVLCLILGVRLRWVEMPVVLSVCVLRGFVLRCAVFVMLHGFGMILVCLVAFVFGFCRLCLLFSVFGLGLWFVVFTWRTFGVAGWLIADCSVGWLVRWLL